jgi:hypothetical protein
MEVSVESVIEQNGAALTEGPETELFAKAWQEARPRVEDYLRAWRLADGERETILCETMRCFRQRVAVDVDLEPTRAAIEEAERLLGDRLNLFLAELRPALEPRRVPETYRTTMQTSLSHLPSFRLIAGWFALIAGLFAAFLLTHH